MQRLRRLLGHRRARLEAGHFAAEGINALTDALAAACVPETVFTTPDADPSLLQRARAAGADIITLQPGVLERVADTVTPQPIVAVFPFLDIELQRLISPPLVGGPVVVVVGVQDPGNLGTIVRTAEAAGATGVVCCDGTVDLYNPKTVRSSAGALFHVPVVVGGDPMTVLSCLAAAGYRRCATGARGGVDYTAADLTGLLAIAVGNEAHGLPADLPVDDWLTIPISGRSESLNVGMATAVVCFEAARQRRASPC